MEDYEKDSDAGAVQKEKFEKCIAHFDKDILQYTYPTSKLLSFKFYDDHVRRIYSIDDTYRIIFDLNFEYNIFKITQYGKIDDANGFGVIAEKIFDINCIKSFCSESKELLSFIRPKPEGYKLSVYNFTDDYADNFEVYFYSYQELKKYFNRYSKSIREIYDMAMAYKISLMNDGTTKIVKEEILYG